MLLYRTEDGIFIQRENQLYRHPQTDWDACINRKNLFNELKQEVTSLQPEPNLTLDKLKFLAPIVSQEIWASGVTYLRSKVARQEESEQAGGADFYARVYDAERPEIFFKATASRTVGHGDKVRIRRDSKWNVPEPELTLFINSDGEIAGYTCGNDMSSRDIEGENPLYLPQAKSYDGSAAIGPGLLVSEHPINPATVIELDIRRNGASIYNNSIELNRMKRSLNELVSYLFRETSFPSGVFLMTGTGIIPPSDFTLQEGDFVRVTINPIGSLINEVTQKR